MTTYTIETREERTSSAAVSAVDWLHLAATPTFATMALFTGVFGTGPQDALCASIHHGSAVGGMTSMYTLMSAFHSVPWLKLIFRRQRAAQRS